MYHKRQIMLEPEKVLVLAIKGGIVNGRILHYVRHKETEIGYGTPIVSSDEKIAYYVVDFKRKRIRRAIVSRAGTVFQKRFKKPVLVLLGETCSRLSTDDLYNNVFINKYHPEDAQLKVKNYVVDFTAKRRIQEVQIVALNKATAEALG